MKRIISAILVTCMILAVTACNSNGVDDRETTFTGETLNTVNPDVSQPQQSIPSDAMITETETEVTEPVKNGNTYTINGVQFTISVCIEDYLYDLPGSDAKYIDLDKFMEAYGFHEWEGKKPVLRCNYGNGNGISVSFDRKSTSIYSNGFEVCQHATISYSSDCYTDGAIEGVTLSSDYPLDKESNVYVVNGTIEDGEIHQVYCISQEMLVAFAVAFDTLNEAGSTAAAVDSLDRACECEKGGGVVVRIM